ncbi:MFS transporter [Microbacteriaceae bacterium 4G12]
MTSTETVQNDKRLSLATRNIALFMIAKLSSLLGVSVYTFAAGLYVLKITGSGTNFAITLVCGSVPRIIFGPIAGTIADRMNRKWLVIGAEICSSVIMLTMFLIAISFTPSLPLIYVSSILISICATFFSVAFTSSIPCLVDDGRIQKAGALNQAATSLASILGPVIGGLIYGFISLPNFMLLNSITFFLAAVIELFIIFDLYGVKKEVKTEAFFASIREGFQYVKENKGLFSILKTALWVNFFFCALMVSLPYIIVQKLSFSSQQYGIIEGMFAVGMLGTSIIISTRPEAKDKFRVVRNGLVILGLLLVSVSLPLIASSLPKVIIFAYYMVVTVLVGVYIISVNIPIQVLIQRTTAEQYRGRVFGLVETIASAISPLGMVFFGLLIDYVPTFSIPLSAGIALFFVAIRGMKSTVKQEKMRGSQSTEM